MTKEDRISEVIRDVKIRARPGRILIFVFIHINSFIILLYINPGYLKRRKFHRILVCADDQKDFFLRKFNFAD